MVGHYVVVSTGAHFGETFRVVDDLMDRRFPGFEAMYRYQDTIFTVLDEGPVWRHIREQAGDPAGPIFQVLHRTFDAVEIMVDQRSQPHIDAGRGECTDRIVIRLEESQEGYVWQVNQLVGYVSDENRSQVVRTITE